jgi:hypothetical protein
MSEYQRVVLEHPDGTIGELRIYPTYVGVWYEDQVFAGQGTLRGLFNNMSKLIEWDAMYVRIVPIPDSEGVEVILSRPQNLLYEKVQMKILICNRKALLKRVQNVFAANI